MRIDHPAPRHIPALRQLWQEAFGDSDEFLDSFFATGFDPQRCRCVLVEDRPAAMVYWFCQHWEGGKAAYLYAIATAQEARHRGFCAALMADTHALLKAQGYDGTILVPANESLARMYEKMGYEYATTVTEFSCQAALAPVAVTKIPLEEFQRRRNAMLPPGSLQPENAGLAFLETQASFYAGDDFLLAGREEDGVFFATELLGNSAAAPGILQALGLSSGTFRCPGKDIPFAMYRPLTDAPPPAYFAFAFD